MGAEHARVPESVGSRLTAIGLTPELVYRIVERGEFARNTTTSNDASYAPGWYAHLARVRALREETVVLGWRPAGPNQLPLALNREGTIAVGVMAGDGGTGHNRKDLRSRYGRGPVTAELVRQNRRYAMDPLFPDGVLPTDSSVNATEDADAPTWFLVTHRERCEDEVRIWVELSLPTRMSDTGHTDRWDDRIILPPLRFKDAVGRFNDHGDEDDGPDGIDVPVRER